MKWFKKTAGAGPMIRTDDVAGTPAAALPCGANALEHNGDRKHDASDRDDNDGMAGAPETSHDRTGKRILTFVYTNMSVY